jgi:hypothetical protein
MRRRTSLQCAEEQAMVQSLRAFGKMIPTACLVAFAFVAPAAANEVVQWNETTMKVIDANGQNNVVATRTLRWCTGRCMTP